MKSYFEILKRLPKTNCQRCGLESCLLFALRVAAGEWDSTTCPYLPSDFRPHGSKETLTFNQLLENLKELKERFRGLRILDHADDLGARFEPKGLHLPYLDDEVVIEVDDDGLPGRLHSQRGFELDPRDEILIINYFLYHGKSPVAMSFVGLESFPHSLSKVKTLKRYAEEPLAKFFEEGLEAYLEKLKAFRLSNLNFQSSSLSFVVYALPKVPLMITYWAGDPEDGLSSYCKVLYDKSAIDYLDLECLVFLAERFTEKITKD